MFRRIHQNHRNLLLPLVATLGATVGVASPRTLQHELIVVEPIGSSTDTTGVSDVSDSGLVVGRRSVNGVLVPFEWTAAAGFRTPTHLPLNFPERRINSHGDSVAPGWTELILADGTRIPIPEPVSGESTGQTDLNDSLLVTAQGAATSTSSGIFSWTLAGGSVTLPIPSGSALRRVNAHGIAVGWRLLNSTNRRAFVVDIATHAWVDLHALLGNVGNSEAFDVNDHGTVAGFGFDGTSLSAFVWSPATGFQFLPGLAGGETMRVKPRAIDNHGRVVGTAMTGAGEWHAFLWDPQAGMIDLNGLVNPGTFKMIEAYDISDSGVIIGRGFYGTVFGPNRGFIVYEPFLGTSYCTGDGSGTLCPCGNSGAAGAGCANSTGAGAVLAASGSTSITLDDLVLTTTGMVPGAPALLFTAQNATGGGLGVPFGDGLHCAGSGVVRLGVAVPDSTGTGVWGPNLGSKGGWQAGQLARLQAWYRDPAGPCGTGFNLSQGLELTILP